MCGREPDDFYIAIAEENLIFTRREKKKIWRRRAKKLSTHYEPCVFKCLKYIVISPELSDNDNELLEDFKKEILEIIMEFT